MNEAPVRLCCMKRHFGPVCQDGKVMCCICFNRFDQNMLNVTKHGPEDVCVTCALRENMIKARIKMMK